MTLAHALFIAALLATASNATSSFDGSRHLWYTKPTTEWEQGALPIGNGRLGGTVWGGANETLNINEDTIWSGPIQDRTPPNALATLPVALKLFLSGKITEGGQLVLREMTPAEKSERQFGYFGNLDLDFGHSGNLKNYVRWLDTKQGNSSSSYAFDGVYFTREFVASYPAGVLAARFTSSEEGALNLKASFSRLANILVNVASTAGGVNSVTLMGSSGQPLDENPILFTGQARFVAPGAKFENDGSVLRMTGATAIDLFFDAETNYRFAPQDEWEAEIDRKLNAALTKGYSDLRDEALKDSSSLLGRASIDLGRSPRGLSALPTDERVVIARKDLSDVELSTLT